MTEKFLILARILAVSVLISACDDTKVSSAAASNFVARISGAVTGQVSGPGLIRFLPPSDVSFGVLRGYYFIADDSGVRELGITFTIPDKSLLGTHQLVSAHPMDSGKEFEVRVDRSVGNRTESFQQNTEGTITIQAFPNDSNNIAGSHIMGSFEFTTQTRNGPVITGKGAFDFYGS